MVFLFSFDDMWVQQPIRPISGIIEESSSSYINYTQTKIFVISKYAYLGKIVAIIYPSIL